MSSGSDFTDVATGHEYVTLLIKKLSDVVTVKYDTDDHEFSTVGYPVFETPIQDLINAHQRASQQLSTLQDGRYAYAQDWNVLANYAKAIINVLVDQLNKLVARRNRRYMRAYGMLLECHRILSTYKYLKTGDVIMPEHTNTLIDVAECLDLTVRLLLRKAINKRSEVDVATGSEVGRLPPLIILVDTDDWETASEWIVDGTIVFVNYGTTAMTPDDVRNIVENKEVVFAVLIDTQPRHGAPAGAFYEVFYSHTRPHACGAPFFTYIIDEQFKQYLGFVYCYTLSFLETIIDYQVALNHKQPDTVLYTLNPGSLSCGYSYKRFGKGAIIELPFNGILLGSAVFDWTIGAIAHVLLGEPNSCYIARNNVKLKRIIWMAGYIDFDVPYCATPQSCLRWLAEGSGWTLLDLRRRR